MTIIYRIFSLIINFVAVMLGISLLGSIPLLASSPQTLLSGFLMIAVILYAWFSFRFRREVLQKRQVVRTSLRDYVRVNEIVTLVFCFFSLISVVSLLVNPQPFLDAVKVLKFDMPLKTAISFFYIMLAYAVIQIVHILWTFALLKKNREYFE